MRKFLNRRRDRQGTTSSAASFDTSVESSRSPISAFYLNQFSRAAVQRAFAIDELSTFRVKLMSSGTFQGDIRMFVAVQVLTVLGALSLVFVLPLLIPGFPVRLLAIIGLLLVCVPYVHLSSEFKKRVKETQRELLFTLRLFMIFSSMAQTTPAALRLVVRHLDGIVSEQISIALDSSTGGQLSLQDALRERVPYLASELARVFFADIAEEIERAVPVHEAIAALQSTVKHELHEHRRATSKKFSTKLTFINFIHFMGTGIGLAGLVALYQLIEGLSNV